MTDPFYCKTVTIWNKCIDGLWEKEVWIPTVIENVCLLASRGNNIQNSGNAAADSARLHISDALSDSQKKYMPYAEWITLADSERESYYTLESENNSFFVEGDSSKEDPSVQVNFFEYMKENYGNCFRITSVDRFEVIPHFEVWGK